MDSSYEYPKFLTERDENGEAYFLPQGGYEGSEGWGRVSGEELVRAWKWLWLTLVQFLGRKKQGQRLVVCCLGKRGT